MLISDNKPVRKSYFDSNIIARILRRFFLRIFLKQTSTEAHVYMRRHQDAKVKHFDVSNVIYHKFSHGAAVNVMLEYKIIHIARTVCVFTVSTENNDYPKVLKYWDT